MGNYKRFTASAAAALIVLAVISHLAYSTSGKVFMDGPLSVNHAVLEDECELCHTPWRGVVDARCLECHEDRESAKHVDAGFQGPTGRCAGCHGEHRSVDHDISFVGDGRCLECHVSFSHEAPRRRMDGGRKKRLPGSGVLLTHNAYYLKGKYQPQYCDQCHVRGKAKPIRHSERLGVNIMYLHMTGLAVKCLDCHADVEVSGFDASGGGIDAKRCLDCHREKKLSGACVFCHRYHGKNRAI